MPAQAANDGSAALNALVRARLAEERGAAATALSALTMVSSLAPDLPGVRGRILEQAIQAGDLDAARTAAHILWKGGDRRFDAQLVLIADAIRRGDWTAARDYLAGRSDRPGNDAFGRLIQPTFNAWIDVGAREAEPERHLVNSGTDMLRPEPALALQAALVQLATRRPSEAAASVNGVTLTDRTSQLTALRVAATFDAAGMEDVAARLQGRIALASGQREDPLLLMPDQPVTSPRAGIAHWLGLLADGLARTPNGSTKLPLLFARTANWLNDADWTVRAALVEALDRNGQRDEAMNMLSDHPATLPPVLTMRRAELLADSGDMVGAAAAADVATRGDVPRSLLVRLADIARRSNDPVAAGQAYRRLEASLGGTEADRPLRATLLIARAELLLQADDWNGAAALMEQAVSLRPDDPVVLNFAGYSALERRRDVDQSLARIEAAWARAPRNPSITDSLGWAYFLTGRTEDAVDLLEQAQRGEPGNAVIVEHLGDAYWQAGRRFQARYTWRAAALLADPDMETRLDAKLRDGLTPETTAP